MCPKSERRRHRFVIPFREYLISSNAEYSTFQETESASVSGIESVEAQSDGEEVKSGSEDSSEGETGAEDREGPTDLGEAREEAKV